MCTQLGGKASESTKCAIACRRFVHGRPISSELELANYVCIPSVPDVIEYSIGFTKADQRGCRVDRHDTRQYLIRVKSLEADSPTDFEGSLNSVSNPLPLSLSVFVLFFPLMFLPLSTSLSSTFR